MGQRHKFMNIDKKEQIETPVFGKLIEWCYQNNSLMLHLEHLLKTEWKDDRVIVVGDYISDVYETSKYKEFLKQVRNENSKYDIKSIYAYPYKIIKETSFYSNRLPSRYIYNTLKKEYFDLKSQPIQSLWYIEPINFITGDKFHPLGLLLACGNYGELGDYTGKNEEYVGSWAESSNSIFLSDELIKNDCIESKILFNRYNEKENNDEILIDFITRNFSVNDIKTVKKINFDPAFFLTDDEKATIISTSIKNIKNKKQEKEIEEELER